MRRALPALAAACLPLLAACSLIGGGDDGPDPTISPPPGMKNVTKGYFAFGVPSDWSEDVGDVTGWRDPNGEITMTLSGGTITQCPTPGNSAGYGTKGSRNKDTGQTVTSVRHFKVPGAAGALRYTLTGGQGGDEVLLQAWRRGCDDSLVLHVAATGDADRIADTIIAVND